MEILTRHLWLFMANHFLTPTDLHAPFSEYIQHCQALVQSQRTDLHQTPISVKRIVEANIPFELKPTNTATIKQNRKGVLLIHGLLGSPFTMRDVGASLQENGFFSRAILLPGHGTKPEDLLSISYRDWIETVKYGIASLRESVDQLFIIGYSLGAALAIQHALETDAIKEQTIDGLILIAPAIDIKVPPAVIKCWQKTINKITSHEKWIYKDNERDYARYISLPYHPVYELIKLLQIINHKKAKNLSCPLFMIITQQDETVSAKNAYQWFLSLNHPKNKLLVYDTKTRVYKDQRIEQRQSKFNELNILNISHIAMPFAPHNFHYGQAGDYWRASLAGRQDCLYSSYNGLQDSLLDLFFKTGLLKNQRLPLTYNPDFNFMMENIKAFMDGI